MEIVRIELVTPLGVVTEIGSTVVPTACGVPVIAPVEAFNESPAGNVPDVKTVPAGEAVIVLLNGSLRIPPMLRLLVIFGKIGAPVVASSFRRKPPSPVRLNGPAPLPVLFIVLLELPAK